MKEHIPVLKESVIQYLNVQKGGIYIDATCGTGHHTKAILEHTDGNCRVICIDKDERAILRAKEFLSEFLEKIIFVNDGFENIEKIMSKISIEKADGILFDLGFSSEQISDPDAGFGFINDGPLDMRFDKNGSITAGDVVNRYTTQQLTSIFSQYGQMRDAERIARLICQERKERPFQSTRQLADFIARNRRKKGRIHPATQVFQAIRIYINRELENLETGLRSAVNILRTGARIVVISYHSLEDRIVKNFMKSEERIKVITKKPVAPDNLEKVLNLSSRSARMRVAEVII